MWHASVARINIHFTAIVPVAKWSSETMKVAKRIVVQMLQGVGTDEWEMPEVGDSAFHLRRRLKATEMRLLHNIKPSCPVFTHGKALSAMVGVQP